MLKLLSINDKQNGSRNHKFTNYVFSSLLELLQNLKGKENAQQARTFRGGEGKGSNLSRVPDSGGGGRKLWASKASYSEALDTNTRKFPNYGHKNLAEGGGDYGHKNLAEGGGGRGEGYDHRVLEYNLAPAPIFHCAALTAGNTKCCSEKHNIFPREQTSSVYYTTLLQYTLFPTTFDKLTCTAALSPAFVKRS